jgi:hypothetical protein
LDRSAPGRPESDIERVAQEQSAAIITKTIIVRIGPGKVASSIVWVMRQRHELENTSQNTSFVELPQWK